MLKNKTNFNFFRIKLKFGATFVSGLLTNMNTTNWENIVT